MEDAIKTSISNTLAKNTLRANVSWKFFTSYEELSLSNYPYKNLEGTISNQELQEYLENCQKQEGAKNITFKKNEEFLGINLEKIVEKFFKIYEEYDKDEAKDYHRVKRDINEIIKSIKQSLQSFQNTFKPAFESSSLDGIEVPITSSVFKKGKEDLEQIIKEIEWAEKAASKNIENESNFYIFKLLYITIYQAHSPIIRALISGFLSSGILIGLIRIVLFANAAGALVAITILVWQTIYYFEKRKERAELKVEIYKFYEVLDKIFKGLNKHNGALASIINLDVNDYGNILEYYNDNTITKSYLTSPNPFILDPALIYTFTLPNEAVIKDSEDQIQKNRTNALREFSILHYFPPKDMQWNKEWFLTNSAFDGLKNMTLQFSNFLFIQTPHFTSTLTLDLILQSLKSKENTQALCNKVVLCVCNILENDNMHYQVQNCIQEILLQRMRDEEIPILFLNLIQNLEKQKFFQKFEEKITKNFELLEKHYNKDSKSFKSNDSEILKDKLEILKYTFCRKGLDKVASDFYSLSDFIKDHKYFKGELKEVSNSAIELIKEMLGFDLVLGNFLDFKSKKDNENLPAKEDLIQVRDRVRTLINDKAPLSPNIFIISHIFNNTYFALNPKEELSSFNNLLAEALKSQAFQKFKTNLESVLDNSEIRKTAIAIMPFKEDYLWFNFFGYDIQKDLYVFILYLYSLDYKDDFKIILQTMQNMQEENIQLEQVIDNTKMDNAINESINELINNYIKNLKEVNRIKTAYRHKDELDIIEKSINYSKKRIENWIRDEKSLETPQLVDELKIALGIEQNCQNTNENNNENTINENLLKNLLKNFQIKQIKSKKATIDIEIIPILITLYLYEKHPHIQDEELSRAVTLMSMGMRSKGDNSYSKWSGDSFFIPKKLSKTLMIGDFCHSMLLEGPLSVGYCIHNPSKGAYLKDEEVAKSQFVEFIKQNSIPHKGEYYDKDYFGNYQDTEATKIYQEAYYKVYAYIDLKKDEKFNFKALSNQTLLEEKAKDKTTKEKDFYPNKDFLISLKRLAEYNYKFYRGNTELKLREEKEGLGRSNFKERLLSNFIYNKDFIPTNIDVKE